VSENHQSRAPSNKLGQIGQGLRRLHDLMHAHPALALVSKIMVSLIGFAVLVTGIVMIVTPGPAIVLIPLGLAILATEFDWARRWLEKARDQARRAKEKAAAQDPKVRRRQRWLAGIGLVVVLGLAGYVVLAGWPAFAVRGWDAVQGLAGWIPELPGM
jgi:uncharacterized protein (TIGR02611 family)